MDTPPSSLQIESQNSAALAQAIAAMSAFEIEHVSASDAHETTDTSCAVCACACGCGCGCG